MEYVLYARAYNNNRDFLWCLSVGMKTLVYIWYQRLRLSLTFAIREFICSCGLGMTRFFANLVILTPSTTKKRRRCGATGQYDCFQTNTHETTLTVLSCYRRWNAKVSFENRDCPLIFLWKETLLVVVGKDVTSSETSGCKLEWFGTCFFIH